MNRIYVDIEFFHNNIGDEKKCQICEHDNVKYVFIHFYGLYERKPGCFLNCDEDVLDPHYICINCYNIMMNMLYNIPELRIYLSKYKEEVYVDNQFVEEPFLRFFDKYILGHDRDVRIEQSDDYIGWKDEE